ncbi:MAG: DUF2490 domain-containing protein [Fimbriimonadaceae bacterium]|nr:DUF2490 domain-containing protein [Fimbriimonadaceae bacterium]
MNTSFRHFALIPILVAFIPTARALDDIDNQGWFQLTFNRRDAKGYRYFGELQQRIGDNFDRPTIFLGRAAIGKQLTDDFSLWIGYAWTPSQLPRWRSEDRYFLQGQWEGRAGAWNSMHRTRLELRNIDGTGGSTYRLRHFVRGTTPFASGSRNYFAVQGELFYNVARVGGNGPRAGYDQTRFFLGIGTNLTRTFRIEAGYQPVWVEIPRTRRLDTLLVSANINF